MDPQVDLTLCALGLALCLFGWVLYWGGIHVVGATAGAAAGIAVAWKAMELSGVVEHRLAIVAAGAALGLLMGVFLLRRLHFGALALLGGALGLAAGLQLGPGGAGQGQAAKALYAVLGAGAGALAFVLLHRYVIVLITSAAGAFLLDLGLMPRNPLLLTLAAFCLASLFQLGIVRRFSLDSHVAETDGPPEAAGKT